MAEEKVLTRAIAENFLFYQGGNLGGFTSIEDDAAEALAKYQGLLVLQSLPKDQVEKYKSHSQNWLTKGVQWVKNLLNKFRLP